MKFQAEYMKRRPFQWFWIALLVLLSMFALAGVSRAAVPDAYEPDNSFEEAPLVKEFDPTQQHSFHQFFDEDWYKFYCAHGPQGPTFRIYVTPQTGSSDPVIEIYSTDGSNLLEEKNVTGPGEAEFLGFQCLENGYYYIRVTNNSPYFGTDVSYAFYMDTQFDILLLPSGYIQGKVTSNGIGLGGVILTNGAGLGFSHSDGTYIIGALRAGDTQLTASKDGYYPRVYSVTVVGDQTTHLDIELEKIPTPSNPPVISGTPSPITSFDQLYSFIPTATDPDGDSIEFSISNKPSWASFNPDNGMLVGVPAKKDLGTYGPIVITVSDSQGQSSSLLPFFIEVKQIMSPGVLMLLNKEK